MPRFTPPSTGTEALTKSPLDDEVPGAPADPFASRRNQPAVYPRYAAEVAFATDSKASGMRVYAWNPICHDTCEEVTACMT